MKSGVFLVAFCARLKTYGALFGDKNHKAFSRFCLCGHEKSGLALAGSISSIGSSFLSWYTTRLIITTKFVQYRTGLFWKTHMNLRHRQLEAITYDQNPVGLIFNFGTVHITGTGSTHLTIPYLMAPAKVVGAFNYAHDKANEMALRADAREPG